MQGLGERITPLVSSSLEMIGKIVIAAALVPRIGYNGVIVAEPLVWFINGHTAGCKNLYHAGDAWEKTNMISL